MAVILRLKIVLIGSGNVATHLGKAISNQRDYPIIQVFSKTKAHARSLGTKLHCAWTASIEELNTQAHLYLIAVQDDQIEKVTLQLKSILPETALIVHTAGSVGCEVLSPYFKNHGVLYPLQTFTKSKKMSYANIPLLVTGSTPRYAGMIKALASLISKKVLVISDETRGYIHLTAVMVNNFPNYLYLMAYQLLAAQNIDFDILLSIIEETSAKIKTMSPREAQTGPARRKDNLVLAKHMELLKKYHPGWDEAYKVMTTLIQNEFK